MLDGALRLECIGVVLSRKLKGSVDWCLPRKVTPEGKIVWYKRPFTTSPVATADWVNAVAEECNTVYEVLRRLRLGYDREAEDIVQHYVDKGWGDLPAKIFGG